MKPKLVLRRALLARIEALVQPGDRLPCIRDIADTLGVDRKRVRTLIETLKYHDAWPYTLADPPPARCKGDRISEEELAERLKTIRGAKAKAEEEGRAFKLDDVLVGEG